MIATSARFWRFARMAGNKKPASAGFLLVKRELVTPIKRHQNIQQAGENIIDADKQ